MSTPTKPNGTNAPRLAFYKQPQQKSNAYQFDEKDLVRSSVVRSQRFRQQQQQQQSVSSTSSTISSSSSSCTSQFISNQVTEGGPAEQVGLKLGDTVTKINQIETKTMSLIEANHSMQQSGNELQLSVKR